MGIKIFAICSSLKEMPKMIKWIARNYHSQVKNKDHASSLVITFYDSKEVTAPLPSRAHRITLLRWTLGRTYQAVVKRTKSDQVLCLQEWKGGNNG